MWQTQDLLKGLFGSVAMIRVSIDFSDLWQTQNLGRNRSGSGYKGLAELAVISGNPQLIDTPSLEWERVRKRLMIKGLQVLHCPKERATA